MIYCAHTTCRIIECITEKIIILHLNYAQPNRTDLFQIFKVSRLQKLNIRNILVQAGYKKMITRI